VSGVGCYIGINVISAVAYADDIVLIAPTSNATRKLLAICDDFAGQCDIVFNAEKSKFLVITSHIRRLIYICIYITICVYVISTSTVN